MRKTLCLCIFLLLLTVRANAQWKQVYSGTRADLTDMCFLDRSNGFAVGENTVIKSQDNGQHWQVIIKDKTFHRINSVIHAKDTIYCFGDHDNGQHFKITFHHDGKVWLKQVIPYSPVAPVFFEDTIWYREEGKLKKRAPQGPAFIVLDKADCHTVRDAHLAISSGNQIFLRKAYHEPWEIIEFAGKRPVNALTDIYFDGGDTLLVATGIPSELYVTYDRGRYWHLLPTQPTTLFNLYSTQAYLGIYIPERKVSHYTAWGYQNGHTLLRMVNGSYVWDGKIGYSFGDEGIIYRSTTLVEEMGREENSLSNFQPTTENTYSAVWEGTEQLDGEKRYYPDIFMLPFAIVSVAVYDSKSVLVFAVEFVPGGIPEMGELPVGQYVARIQTFGGTIVRQLLVK